jgi:hypothetical protein
MHRVCKLDLAVDRGNLTWEVVELLLSGLLSVGAGYGFLLDFLFCEEHCGLILACPVVLQVISNVSVWLLIRLLRRLERLGRLRPICASFRQQFLDQTVLVDLTRPHFLVCAVCKRRFLDYWGYLVCHVVKLVGGKFASAFPFELKRFQNLVLAVTVHLNKLWGRN